jgi:hypothetical protein
MTQQKNTEGSTCLNLIGIFTYLSRFFTPAGLDVMIYGLWNTSCKDLTGTSKQAL